MRLGIFGGTFDPIHRGHLACAVAARDRFRMDRLLLLPAALPPHKQGEHVTAFRHRLAMVALAARGIDRIAASSDEALRVGPSFTVDTLARFRATLDPSDPLLFLLGSDSLAELHAWRDPAGILSLANLVVAPRPGASPAQVAAALTADLRARLIPPDLPIEPLPPSGNMYWLALPEQAVSGTEIRRRIRAGAPLEGLVPDAVAAYISEQELYTEGGTTSWKR
jgi:nicotinate-nucleotide adenylyltransferase